MLTLAVARLHLFGVKRRPKRKKIILSAPTSSSFCSFLGRRFRALKLWFVLRRFGAAGESVSGPALCGCLLFASAAPCSVLPEKSALSSLMFLGVLDFFAAISIVFCYRSLVGSICFGYRSLVYVALGLFLFMPTMQLTVWRLCRNT